MIVCSERCGSSFSPIRAATIRDCLRCLLRDDLAVPLIVSRFKEPATDQKEGRSKSSKHGPPACDGMGSR
jgi:hypothetical protein